MKKLGFLFFAAAAVAVAGSAHAELASSVTCGKVTSFEGTKVHMRVGQVDYVLNKAHLPTHLKVPGEACLSADRMPAADLPESIDTKFPLLAARPSTGTQFVKLSAAEQAKFSETAKMQAIVFKGLSSTP